MRNLISFKILFSASISLLSVFHLMAQPQSNTQSQDVTTNEQLFQRAVNAGDKSKAAQYACQLGVLYKLVGKKSKAVSSLKTSVQYARKYGDTKLQQEIFRKAGQAYFEMKLFDNALDAFERDLMVAEQFKNKPLMIEDFMSIALCHGGAENYKKSIEPLEKALAFAIELKQTKTQQDCYKLLAEYYKQLGNTIKATEYTAQYTAITELKQHDESTSKQIRKLKEEIDQANAAKVLTESELRAQKENLQRAEDSLILFEQISAKRQLEIDLLNKDKQLAALEIKAQNERIKNEELVRNGIIAGIVMSLIFLAVIIFEYRKQVKQNKKIREQNQSIKSSINYAKRIQEAMLHQKVRLENLQGHSFVLFKPRDVVSGDFYWFSEIRNGHSSDAQKDLAFAAVDCTGHGVPGAFMSMIGMNSLNGIVNRGVEDPHIILETLHSEIRTALRQEQTGNNDGMDVTLCVLRRDKKILEFAGAKGTLIYIQENELHQVKGDVHPIGGSKAKHQISFKKHEISLDKPTMVYLFSDGYRDQFGGKANTKFMSKKFSQLLLDIHQKPLEEQKELLDQTIEEWKGDRSQTDDILVMGISVQ